MNKKNTTKKMIMVITMFVILLSYSCQSNKINNAADIYIYITYETYTEWQVWQIAINGKENNLVYSLPKSISINNSFEKKYFSEEIVERLVDEYSEEIKSKPFETSVSIEISPSKKYIAITEGYRYCPNNRCTGQYSIRLININSGEQIFEYYSDTPLSSPKWSNDEKYLLFEKLDSGFPKIISSIHLWSIQNGHELVNMYGQSSDFIDNTYEVVYEYYDKVENLSTDNMYCCKIIDPIHNIERTINVDESIAVYPFSTFSLSPDAESIAFKLYDDHLAEIKILDFLTLKQLHSIIPINSDAELWGLDWSSDGEYIAFESGVIGEDNILEVVDIGSNTTLFVERDIPKWKWSTIDQKMLLVKINNPKSCFQKDIEINIFDFARDEKSVIESPDEIKDFIDGLASDKFLCIQYIHDVTW